MKLAIINFLFGSTLIKAEGVFSERIINIAGEKGIFIWGLRRIDPLTVTFFVSRKAAKALLSLTLPQGISISIEKNFGLPALFSRFKKRKMLLFCPAAVFILLFLSTQFIWNINVITDDPNEERLILSELKKLGLKRGALKMNIKQSDIKRRMILSNDSLLWIWVEIKGSGAIVRLAERAKPPEVFDEETYQNIYASRDCVITELIARNGVAKVSVGDTVVKGQLLIEGIIPLSDGSATLVHASGTVKGSVWEEKTVTIPKKEEIRTPTGNSTERLSIKFSDFLIKLFINSRISYQTYDIIEKENTFTPLNLHFIKTTVREVNVSYKEHDAGLSLKASEDAFKSELTKKGLDVKSIVSDTRDLGSDIEAVHKALCETDVSVERRMNIGNNSTITEH